MKHFKTNLAVAVGMAMATMAPATAGANTGTDMVSYYNYSAASSNGAGNIVVATEMIPDTPRNTVANWGTYISRLSP